MTDDMKESKKAGYEIRDVRARWAALAGLGLVLGLCLVLMITWLMVETMEQQLPNTVAPEVSTTEFPAPNLQTNPLADLENLRDFEEDILNNYRWIDREQEIIALPIERAMELVAENGVPEWDMSREESPEE